jgi:hypothetical protein
MRPKGRCQQTWKEASGSVQVKVRGDVFASFHAVAAKRRSRTRNSQFGLLGPVLRATPTAVLMVALAWNILDTTSYPYAPHEATSSHNSLLLHDPCPADREPRLSYMDANAAALLHFVLIMHTPVCCANRATILRAVYRFNISFVSFH